MLNSASALRVRVATACCRMVRQLGLFISLEAAMNYGNDASQYKGERWKAGRLLVLARNFLAPNMALEYRPETSKS